MKITHNNSPLTNKELIKLIEPELKKSQKLACYFSGKTLTDYKSFDLFENQSIKGQVDSQRKPIFNPKASFSVSWGEIKNTINTTTENGEARIIDINDSPHNQNVSVWDSTGAAEGGPEVFQESKEGDK